MNEFICSFLVALAFLCAAQAFNISAVDVSRIDSGKSLWKPSRLVKFSDSVFCFDTEESSCGSTCRPFALCSFDGGKHIRSLPDPGYCRNGGVVVNGTLLCPDEQLSVSDVQELRFSVASFAPHGGEIRFIAETNKNFSFMMKGAAQKAVRVIFTGNSVHMTENDAYVMAVILVSSDDTRSNALFSSADGLSWAFVSEVPLPISDEIHLVHRGKGKIAIASKVSGMYQVVSSGYSGRWWSGIKYLNTSFPPASVSYSSGVYVSTGMSNTSVIHISSYVDRTREKPLTVSIQVEHDALASAKNLPLFSTLVEDGAHTTSSSLFLELVPLSSSDGKKLMLFYDLTDRNGVTHLFALTFVVADEGEVKERAAELAKEAERRRVREAEQVKAMLEKHERQVKERRERLRKQKEFQSEYMAWDSPHIVLAEKRMDEDGELIVVRQVQAKYIDMEKETFF